MPLIDWFGLRGSTFNATQTSTVSTNLAHAVVLTKPIASYIFWGSYFFNVFLSGRLEGVKVFLVRFSFTSDKGSDVSAAKAAG